MAARIAEREGIFLVAAGFDDLFQSREGLRRAGEDGSSDVAPGARVARQAVRGGKIDRGDEPLARRERLQQIEVALARRVQTADEAIDDAQRIRGIEVKLRSGGGQEVAHSSELP